MKNYVNMKKFPNNFSSQKRTFAICKKLKHVWLQTLQY